MMREKQRSFFCPTCKSREVGFYQKMKLAWKKGSEVSCNKCSSKLYVSDFYRILIVLPLFGFSIPFVVYTTLSLLEFGVGEVELAIALSVVLLIFAFFLVLFFVPLSIKK